MRKEEIQILEDISKIQKKQGILLEKPKTPQQFLLQLSGQRYLLSKKMLHKNIEEVLNYLEGSFSQKVLQIGYMSLCLQNTIELPSQKYPILKLLIDWTQFFPLFQAQSQLDLVDLIFQKRELIKLDSIQEYIAYINFIGADIIKAIRRQKNINLDESLSSSKDSSQKFAYDHVNLDKLLEFINLSLPNILYNIILPNQILPHQFQKKTKNLECLFKNASLQYFMRSRSHYGIVMKILIKVILTMNLKPTQQKLFMDIVFRYFYAFHHDKKYNATDIFIQAYNKLSEPTRFALTDELVLFFRIIGKIGKGKFTDFLIDKSQWLKEITDKINSNSQIGYNKDGVYPYNKIGFTDQIVIDSGKLQTRTFQILEDYSMFYFKFETVSLDITIKLYFLGDITNQKPTKTVLLEQQKNSGIFSNNVMAAKRGLYMFQFDNSYSWMNSKTVKYSISILTPLDMQTKDRYQWINTFYDNIPQNKNTSPDKIWIIRKIPVKKEDDFIGTANITKVETFYNLKITKPRQVYEFETEDEEKFIQKFNQLNSSKDKLNWMIDGEPIENTQNVQGFILKNKKSTSKKQPTPPKEKIEMNYVEEEQEIDERPSTVSNKNKDSTVSKQSTEGSKIGSKTDLNESAKTSQKV